MARVVPADLQVTAQLGPLGTYPQGTREVTLEIKNPTQLTVTNVQARVLLFDCPFTAADIDSSCETDVSGSFVGSIPPSQSRQLKTGFVFRDVPKTKGLFRWSYTITAVRAT